MTRTLLLLSLFAGAVATSVACSSTTSGTGSSSSSSSGGSSSGGSSSGGSSSGVSSSSGSSGPSANQVAVQGTLGGRSFAAVSGIANIAIGGDLHLVFVDSVDLCTGLKTQKFPAGTTLVALYGLTGTAPGEFTPSSDNPKYATVASTCPSGASVNDHVDGSGRATPATTTVTVDTLTDSRVAGEIHVTFDDGSTVDGTFDLPLCSVAEAENATCE